MCDMLKSIKNQWFFIDFEGLGAYLFRRKVSKN
jgi:hypothetical protein